MKIPRERKNAENTGREPSPSTGGRRGLGLMSYREAQQALKPGAPASEKAAEKAPEASAQKDDGTPAGRFAAAQAAYSAGAFDEAAALFHAVYHMPKVNKDQQGVTAFNVAQCHRLLGRPADAARWYQTARASGSAKLGPFTREIEEKLAMVNAEAAGRPAAEVSGAGETAEALYGRANVAYAGGAFLTASALFRASYDAASGRAPDVQGRIAFNIAQCARLTQQNLDAKSWYERALGHGVGSYEAETRKYLAEMEASLIPEARGANQKGAKTKKAGKAKAGAQSVVEAARDGVSWANDLYSQGYYDQAAEAYIEAFHAPGMPADKKGHLAFNTAQCHRMLGQSAAAIRWYEVALATGGVEPYRGEVEGFLAKLRGGESRPKDAPIVAAAPRADVSAPAGKAGRRAQ